MVSLVISAGNSSLITSAGCFEDGEPVCLVKNFPWGFLLLYRLGMAFVLLLEFSEGGQILVLVDYLDQRRKFCPEELLAMIYRKVKIEAEQQMGKEIDKALIVPNNFRESQRKTTLDAASIAGFICLRLYNESSAVALSMQQNQETT